MVKRIILLFIAFWIFGVGIASGQILKPVEWEYNVAKNGDQLYELQLIADIDSSWYIYGQEIEGEGPIPTSFEFQEEEGFELIGDVEPREEGKVKKDEMFGAKFTTFQGKTVFVQEVKVEENADVDRISGELEFMTCTKGKCLPPSTKNFTFELKEEPEREASSKKKEAKKSDKNWESTDQEEPNKSASSEQRKNQKDLLDPVDWDYELEKIEGNQFELTIKADIKAGWRIYGRNLDEGGPQPTSFDFQTEEQSIDTTGTIKPVNDPIVKYDSVFGMELTYFKKSAQFTQKLKLEKKIKSFDTKVRFMTCDNSRCLPPENENVDVTLTKEQLADVKELKSAGGGGDDNPQTMWGIFLAGFAGGFVALLTPCVFPMIPLTVSFFTKSSPNKSKGIINALIYGLSIIIIYVGLGFLVTKLFGPSALNEMASNIWFNLAFFLIFLMFAISLFGAFELTLPSSWADKADKMSDKGGLIGIFFMAFTLAVVSFSCTGPIIGPLLVQSAVMGGNLGPIMGMGGFSLALALPFTLFAIFPGWLNTLPKSGGWMNTVKVTLGFLELGLALKFLSNVDMAYSWGILPREIFLGLWMLIALALALYLFGVYKFPHDTPGKKLSLPRAVFGLLFLAFAGYTASGIAGNTLHYLSGFPPPSFYSVWDTKNCPQGFNCFHDYDKALTHAKQVDKPLMIDFTGWSCVNCRKMEENVWIKPDIKQLIEDEYILVSLYVDEKEKLPKDERYVSDFSGQKVTTVGNKWSDFQATRFGANSQPYYVLLDENGEKLIEPKGYTPDPKAYEAFLEKGLEAYEEKEQQVSR